MFCQLLPFSLTHSHEVQHVLPHIETYESHKPPGLYIPLIYSQFISFIMLLTQASVQWFHRAPLRPRSNPGLSASSHSKHPLAASDRAAAPGCASLGLTPRGGKRHLSSAPNKR